MASSEFKVFDPVTAKIKQLQTLGTSDSLLRMQGHEAAVQDIALSSVRNFVGRLGENPVEPVFFDVLDPLSID